MKLIWEPEDIPRYLGNSLRGTSNEQWMLGYRYPTTHKEYCLISLRDGMVTFIGDTKEAAAEHLNKGGAMPTHPLNISVQDRLENPKS